MEPLALLRRMSVDLAATAAGLVMLASAVRANEVSGAGGARGIVVHGSDETLRDYCQLEDGVLWLVLPGGSRWELVMSTTDPAIANPGDGAFHPFDVGVVRQALSALAFPLTGVEAEIFALPYPRRSGLESAAGPGLVLLAPGVRPLSAERQHAELAHELGHVVQYRLMPDGHEAWDHYRALRGIADPTVYSAASAHASRPHEIFAEDFRALFGGALANYSGTIENADLPVPASVDGLADFMLALAGATTMPSQVLAASPNPGGGALSIRRVGSAAAAPIDLFDLAGRRLTTLQPTATTGGWTWSWNGLDRTGRALPPGVVLARERDTDAPALRIVRVQN